MHGMLLEVRRWGPGPTELLEKQPCLASAVDVLCQNDEGGAIVGAVAGSDWVAIDWAAFVNGGRPRVAKSGTTAAVSPALGCVHWSEGSVANGKQCWVRIFGRHPYAKVDGTNDVAVGTLLGASGTAGVAALTNTPFSLYGFALAALVTDGVGAVPVHIVNPMNLLT